MCNIAGYVGDKQAAPILIEMIKKQEGFAGGFYTGIATIHEGKIHYAKLTGDTDTLLKETNALNLPGTIGIIHSRSKSGGGDSWAHPFIGMRGGKECEAYVANGYAGKFAICDKEYGALIKELRDDGCKFTSENHQTVHMSDVMCQLIARNIAGGDEADKAIENAFCTMPNEIVGLLLSLTKPDRIFWGRINRPMMLSFLSGGAYISTTAMAFPDDCSKVITLPVNSSGYVKCDGFEVKPFEKAPARVAEINEGIFEKGIAETQKALKEGEKTFKQIEKKLDTLFPDGNCGQGALLGYEVLRFLKNSNKINIITSMTEGAKQGLLAPRFEIRLKE